MPKGHHKGKGIAFIPKKTTHLLYLQKILVPNSTPDHFWLNQKRLIKMWKNFVTKSLVVLVKVVLVEVVVYSSKTSSTSAFVVIIGSM